MAVDSPAPALVAPVPEAPAPTAAGGDDPDDSGDGSDGDDSDEDEDNDDQGDNDNNDYQVNGAPARRELASVRSLDDETGHFPMLLRDVLGELGNEVLHITSQSATSTPHLASSTSPASTSELQMVFEARELSRHTILMDLYPPTTTPSAVQPGGLYGLSATPTARTYRQQSTTTFLVVLVGLRRQ